MFSYSLIDRATNPSYGGSHRADVEDNGNNRN